MNYCERKAHLIDEIEENCKKLNNDQLCKILKKTEEYKPKILHEFIKEMFEKETYRSGSIKELFCNEKIYDAFEHEVRSLCLELGYNFSEIKASSDNVDHFCELKVNGQDLDIWIHEGDPLFNPSELAYVIYLLYTKEITFR